jgi:hypothetical protein
MSKPGADAEPGVVPGGWIRPVLPLAVICCLAELSYAVVNVLAIPAYISKGVGLGAHVGTIMSAFLLAEALGRPGLGTLSDLFGRGYRARIRNHGHSCFLCEIVIRSQFHTTYEPEA